jgi:transmembrane sensor
MNIPKTDREFKELAKKIELGTATEAEKITFDYIYDQLSQNNKNWNSRTMGDENAVKTNIYNTLNSNINQYEKATISKNWFYKYAAAIVILATIGFSTYKYISIGNSKNQYTLINNFDKDITSYNKAYLTLATGKKISLTDASQGKLLQDGGIKISKTKEGQVVYQIVDNNEENQNVSINTISTPVGGQYMVILPDNSQVWLNAASSISFPTSFKDKTRNVSITGEAYFEISKNAEKPFIVKSGDVAITVLGTHFDIMNYTDEPKSKITLLEGSIKLDLGSSSQIIKPGQQAIYSKNSEKITLTTVETEDVIGWKRGYFLFDNSPIEEVLREIKRWYDIDITYNGIKTNMTITAMISRKNSLNKVLNLLEKSAGLNFEINNKQITVKKIKEETE